MREWFLTGRGWPCGACCRLIPEKTPALRVTNTETNTKRIRCVACAKAVFSEEPPTEIAEDAPPPVPVPSLPFSHHRQPDVVTKAAVKRSAHYNDMKQRQTGDKS